MSEVRRGRHGASGSPDLAELLAGAPSNWGRWGPDDEVGALNHLTPERVLGAVGLVRSGRVFTLAIPAARAEGDPVFPGRTGAQHFMVADASSFAVGARPEMPGGLKFADDYVVGFAQLGTHCDALGHMWFGNEIWNGAPAESTIGGMRYPGIEPIARRGIVGRGVLLDIARMRGVESLGRAETVTHLDLERAAAEQGVELRPGDVLLVRTGWMVGCWMGRPLSATTTGSPG